MIILFAYYLHFNFLLNINIINIYLLGINFLVNQLFIEGIIICVLNFFT